MPDRLEETAVVRDGALVITIPLPVLQTALEGSANWSEDDEITDIEAFAKAMAEQVHSEAQEDGSTHLHLMLDEWAGRAIEDDCQGVSTKDWADGDDGDEEDE